MIVNLKVIFNKSSEKEILTHLTKCNNDFVPTLSSTINLNIYANKLYTKSIRLELWVENDLIGLLAVYTNNKEKGYITNMSILSEYYGKGFAQLLLDACIKHLKELAINRVELEVNKENSRAIKFYEKNKFILKNSNEISLHLSKSI